MSTAGSGNERLRLAFDGATTSIPSRESCLSDEEIWQLARGKLESVRKRKFLNHLLEKFQLLVVSHRDQSFRF